MHWVYEDALYSKPNENAQKKKKKTMAKISIEWTKWNRLEVLFKVHPIQTFEVRNLVSFFFFFLNREPAFHQTQKKKSSLTFTAFWAVGL